MQLEKLADMVVLTIKTALAPVLERLAVTEQCNKDLQVRVIALAELRDRLTTVETKAATFAEPREPAPRVDLSPVLERVSAAEARLSVLGDLRDRVVTVETKAALQAMPEPVTFDAAPLLARVAALEGDLKFCQDRLLVAETKAAMPPPVLEATEIDVSPLLERLSTLEIKVAETAPLMATAVDLTKDLGALRERVAVAEVRALVAGPAGKDGANGANGLNGKDGADGLGYDDLTTVQQDERSFTIKAVKGDRVKDIGTARFPVQIQRGVYIEGKEYEHGDVVTWGGSQWHANEETTTKPGDGSKAWTLIVKRGRDGKDGRDGQGGPPQLPVLSVGSR